MSYDNIVEELNDIMQGYFGQLSDQKRYLFAEIDWSNRLLGIKGARGTGKTTLLLQSAKEMQIQGIKVLYASADEFYFLDNSLLDLGREFTQAGGSHLFLDEVHKYPRWSRELKLLYDRFPNLNIVFTSSSMLEIFKGESDLSRRLITYHLRELSFREYLSLKEKIELPPVAMEDLLNDHLDVAKNVKALVEFPILHFKQYLERGAYPYAFRDSGNYVQRVQQTINLILEVDLNAVENMPYADSRKIKKLLVAIAESAPFTPNITKLSSRLGMSRNFLINAVKILGRADLVIELYKPTKGIGALTKPEKLYLHNTNLMYALGKKNVEVGSLRETFFANQMLHFHSLHLAEKGDFLVDEKYTFEIGGKGKDSKQIYGIDNAFVVKDDVEYGGQNSIPLYLFGFMY